MDVGTFTNCRQINSSLLFTGLIEDGGISEAEVVAERLRSVKYAKKRKEAICCELPAFMMAIIFLVGNRKLLKILILKEKRISVEKSWFSDKVSPTSLWMAKTESEKTAPV